MALTGPADSAGGQSVGGLMSGLMGAMFGGGASPKASAPLPYYTQGKTVQLGTEWFLITYRAQFRPLDMTAMMAAKGPGDLRYLATRANGQPAVGMYLRKGRDYEAFQFQVLHVDADGRIDDVVGWFEPHLFRLAGLPQVIPG